MSDSIRHIGGELRGLSKRIHRFIENSPNKKKIDCITGTNGWIIAFLSCNKNVDIFQKDVEKEFDVTRSTASKVIDLMEQKGLVERRKVPGDARLRKLVLTPKAEELSVLFEEDRLLLEQTLMQGFSEEERLQLLSYLTRMKNNLETVTKEEGQCIQ